MVGESVNPLGRRPSVGRGLSTDGLEVTVTMVRNLNLREVLALQSKECDCPVVTTISLDYSGDKG